MIAVFLHVAIAFASILGGFLIIVLRKELGDLSSSPVLMLGLTSGKSYSLGQNYLENRDLQVPFQLSVLCDAGFLFQVDCHAGMSGTIYDYGALTIDGQEYIPFKQYAGKYILFVNVATY